MTVQKVQKMEFCTFQNSKNRILTWSYSYYKYSIDQGRVISFNFKNFDTLKKIWFIYVLYFFHVNFFMYFYSNNGVFREPIQVTTYESITGHSTILPIAWVEIHPLFDGQEFDLAILGLKSYIQRKLLINYLFYFWN